MFVPIFVVSLDTGSLIKIVRRTALGRLINEENHSNDESCDQDSDGKST